jgi:hypothetical protein
MPVAPAAFTLFFGNNEDGKTLTIDALIKLLLGRKVRNLRGLLYLKTGRGSRSISRREGNSQLSSGSPLENAAIYSSSGTATYRLYGRASSLPVLWTVSPDCAWRKLQESRIS